MKLSEAQARFKADYIRDRGYWVPFNDGLLEHAPQFLQTYFEYAALPARTGPLSVQLRELIYVAVDTSSTHMFGQGLEIHVKAALAAGCSAQQLIEVMELATAQGLDSVSRGIGIVVEELAAAEGCTDPSDTRDLTTAEAALRDDYVARFGDWPRWCDLLVRRDPDYFAAMTRMLDGPALTGGLDAKTRSLIAFALAASPTHLEPEAMRLHAARAIRAGATGPELVEALQLVAHLGIHACVIGVPLIAEAAG